MRNVVVTKNYLQVRKSSLKFILPGSYILNIDKKIDLLHFTKLFFSRVSHDDAIFIIYNIKLKFFKRFIQSTPNIQKVILIFDHFDETKMDSWKRYIKTIYVPYLEYYFVSPLENIVYTITRCAISKEIDFAIKENKLVNILES